MLAAWVQASRPVQDEEAVALDGKAVRGAATTEHKAPHLLSFYTHKSQETLLQVRVSKKTNEIPIAKAVLPCLSKRPRVSTADALHTHAAFMEVAHAHSGASLLTVKVSGGMNDSLAPTWPLIREARSLDPHHHCAQDRQNHSGGRLPHH